MAARIWIDIETTGLDYENDHLLEVAVVATDAKAPHYTELASQTWVVRPNGWDAEQWRLTVDPVVYEMHTKSGLWGEVYAGANLADVEAELLKFIGYFGNPAPGREPIGGSSAHFDARFLEVHMPKVRRYWSHRVFDASTLKQLARDFGVEPPAQTATAHRALADVRYSIELTRWVAGLMAQGRA